MTISANTAAVQQTVLNIKARLERASIDEVVTHDELKEVIPSNLRRYINHYVLVNRAKKLLNAENGAVFATVRKVGYRRLRPVTGAERVGNTALMRIRRQARGARTIATVALRSDVTSFANRRVYQQIAALGLVEHLTAARTVSSMPEDAPNPSDGLDGLRNILGRGGM
jgi:hypothetical protein